MGGWPPLGYRVESRRLLVVESEAALVQRIFTRFAETGSVPTVVKELRAAGEVTKQRPFPDGRVRGGLPWTKGAVYKLLANRLYRGEAVHKGVAYPGEHQAIVDQRLWQRVHAVLAEPARSRAGANRAKVPMLLRGILYGPKGRPMSPSHTRRRGRVYRYYVTREAIEDGYASCPIRSVPADDVEAAVLAVRIPMRLHRQRGRKRIVAPDGTELTPASTPRPDGALVKAPARAWRWQRLLDQGVYRSVTDIAQAENLNKSYVSRILRLALLAPELVEAILAGTADNEVTLRTLKEGVPLDWKEQLRGCARIDAPSPDEPLAKSLAVPDPDRPVRV